MLCKSDLPQHAQLCDHALALKSKIFPLTRANEKKYIHFAALYNPSGAGIMQQVERVESAIFDCYYKNIEKWRKHGLDLQELKKINTAAEALLKKEYLAIQ
jgi:hypothetical protein